MNLAKLQKVLIKAGYSVEDSNSRYGYLGGVIDKEAEIWLLVDGVPFMIKDNHVEDKPVNLKRYFNYFKG